MKAAVGPWGERLKAVGKMHSSHKVLLEWKEKHLISMPTSRLG